MNVYFFGKLAAADKKDAAEIVRKLGGRVVSELNDKVHLAVIGESQLFDRHWNMWNDAFDAATKNAFRNGTLQVITETEFWYAAESRESETSSLFFTVYSLAKLTGIPLGTVRHLESCGVLVPVKRHRRLAFFEHHALLTLKIAKKMFDAGWTLHLTKKRLKEIQRFQPKHSSRVSVEGKNVLLESGTGILEQTGQQRLF